MSPSGDTKLIWTPSGISSASQTLLIKADGPDHGERCPSFFGTDSCRRR